MPDIVNIQLYDKNNNCFLTYSNNKKQSYVKLDKINKNIINAFISIEDKRFYHHHGVDIIRIGGALLANLKSNGITEGASTITQQYVRSIFLSNEQTIKRKITEAMIAINFESKYTKEEILEGYLNAIYFDHGIYGVEDASIFYFNKHASELSILEACAIASIPKGPLIYSPLKNAENNKIRRELILEELLKDSLITNEQYNEALNEELTFIGNNPKKDDVSAPFFHDYIINEIKKIPSVQNSTYQGLKVYTSLDGNLNNTISEAIKKRIPSSGIEVAVVAIEAKTGKILSLFGGKDYNESQYNRALYSLRQPGSSIKPFLYLSALENNFTLATTFKSEPTTFYFKNTTYSPGNFKEIYANQDISMVYALATSDNIYAIKTHLFLGPHILKEKLTKLGISTNIPDDLVSLPLGTKETSLMNLTSGYQMLANLGTQIKPYGITKITTYDDKILYENKVIKKEISDSDDVYILNEAMTYLFDNRITYNIRPTGVSISSLLKMKLAAKSGSTDTDNLFLGYNADIVIGIWSGYDDNKEITNVQDLSFGKYLFADIINGYYKDKTPTWYETPDNCVYANLCPLTGFYPIRNEYVNRIYFKKENLPWFVKILYN